MAHPDAWALVTGAAARGLEPPPRLGIREWADRYRRLPTKGAAEPGAWRTSRTPYLAEIMDVLDPGHPAKRVVLVKSAQVGGTEIGLNMLGHWIATQRAPILCVQPTLEMAERWSKQRLAAMIEDTPSLRGKIAPARSRDSGNTTLLKEWPGGLAIISGANSAAGLRSMPARAVFADEVDGWPPELEGEGDPLKLAEARTATFARRKMLLVSTPTIESLSRIWREWLASDQRRYHVACPDCGHYQPLTWTNLRWPEGRPSETLYHCAECGVGVPEHRKPDMLETGQWIAEHPERPVVGFHLNALYTPIGLGLSWGELAAEWEEVRHDAARSKTFTNIRLGECVADPSERFEVDELRAMAGDYALRTVPRGCLLLTAGVDIQGDRWAILVLGHGREGRQWIVDWVELPGDPTNREDWSALEDYLARPLTNAFGVPIRVSMTAVDSGYLQDDVMTFVRPRRTRGYIALKGSSTYGRPILTRPSKIDVGRTGKTLSYSAQQWPVGSDTAKEQIFRRLAADRKRLIPAERLVHFPQGLDESFYSQITAEIYDPRKRRWVKVRPRNEALDCWVYALAAAHHPTIGVNKIHAVEWDRLERALEPATGDLFAPTPPKTGPASAPETRPQGAADPIPKAPPPPAPTAQEKPRWMSWPGSDVDRPYRASDW